LGKFLDITTSPSGVYQGTLLILMRQGKLKVNAESRDLNRRKDYDKEERKERNYEKFF
jgi:HSP20 family molecular chaperone IbpA